MTYAPMALAVVRIRPIDGNLSVMPEGTASSWSRKLEVSVVQADESPVPNQTVALSLAATELTAGHLHSGGKSAGSLSATSVTTGPQGTATVTYTAPTASGPVRLRGTSAGATAAEITLSVGVPGLVPLAPSNDYLLVGALPLHPDNHYGAPRFNQALETLAGSFFDRYRLPLEYNDMSLEQGGVFDTAYNWQPPHNEHRLGTNVDLEFQTVSNGGTVPLDSAQLNFIRATWNTLSTESATRAIWVESTHWHLRY